MKPRARIPPQVPASLPDPPMGAWEFDGMTGYTLTKNRPAGKIIVSINSVGMWKCRAANLADAPTVRGKWSRQAGGYVMSPTAFRRWWWYLTNGWNASPISHSVPTPPKKPE